MAQNLDLEKWKSWCNILSVNSDICFSYVKWDDVASSLTGLKLFAKNEEYRSRITEEIVEQCRNFIEHSRVLDFNKCCGIQMDSFRFLRNCCAGSTKNQDYVMSCGLLSIVIEIVEQVLKLNQDSDVDCVKQVLSSAIQLLGNLVVEHGNNQETVWARCYPYFFMKIMRCQYNEVKNYICMVIYNCMKQKARAELCTECEGLSLVTEIVKMCCTNDTNVEWGVFIIESLIQNGSFQQVYTGLSDDSLRVFLLELIEYKLKGSETSKYCMSWISLDNALFISQTFEDNISRILNFETSFNIDDSSNEVILVNTYLRLLCLLTVFEEEYEALRSRKCLLETALVALRETSSEENKRFFSDLSHLSNPSDNMANAAHPAFGFKRSLIQLIANMCFLNTVNQDCVRQMDGIPLLLDHCNIDDYNPYICQWAIFCLRNILENNLENQQVIRSLTKLGLASNTGLAEAGFVVEETTDGKLRVVGKQNKDIAP